MSKPVYRKIWEENYGPIPVDSEGRSYDIHHINGNHHDDRLENLQCVSIEEHYEIHQRQGDIMACCAIARRMLRLPEFTEEEKIKLSEEAKIAARKRVENGTHNFLGGEIQKAHQARRKQQGTHNFVKSNPNYLIKEDGSREVLVNCIDKLGNKHRIEKSQYLLQKGNFENWEYVSHSSKEGRRRILYKKQGTV